LELFKESANYSTAVYPGSGLHSNSLLNIFQLIYIQIYDKFPFNSSKFQFMFNIFQLISFVFLFWIFLQKRFVLDNFSKIILPISFMTLFFGTSFDYRLIYFFIPLLVLLATYSHPLKKLNLILLFILIQPKPFLVLTTMDNTLGLTLGSLINPILIIVLLYLDLSRYLKKTNLTPML
jgi:hypothetical protein